MQEIRLYLDEQLVDVSPSAVITETKQVNSLFELRDRQSSGTNGFDLLLTKETNAVLERIGDPYNTSDVPYKRINADLYRDGTPTILNGSAEISRVEGKEVASVNIVSGIADFFETMGNKSISDLDLSPLNHIATGGEVVQSYDHEWADGYIYAMADYGVFNPEAIDLRYQMPSLFMKYIWEQIFIQNNKTYSYRGLNNPLDSDHFKSKAITVSGGLIGETNGTVGVRVDLYDEDPHFSAINKYLLFTELEDTEGFVSPVSGVSVITPPQDGTYRFDLVGEYDGGNIVVELNGTNLNTYTGVIDNSFTFPLTTTDEVRVYVDYGGVIVEARYSLSLKISRVPALVSVDFSNAFSKLKQKDFFKSVLQMYGLTFQRRDHTNHYEFRSYEELFTDMSGAQDYTSKYHELLTRKYKHGSFGQTNTASYNYDESDADFADGSFNLRSENLPRDAKIFTMPYKAIEIDTQRIGDNEIYLAPLFTVTLNDDGTVKDVKSKASKPYIINITKKNATFNYKTDNGSSSLNRDIPFADFTELKLQHILDTYYDTFIRVKNNTKVYTIECALTSMDVMQFDFLRLVYITQLQTFFYCNKIVSYRGHKVTKMELVEINTAIINNEPTTPPSTIAIR